MEIKTRKHFNEILKQLTLEIIEEEEDLSNKSKLGELMKQNGKQHQHIV